MWIGADQTARGCGKQYAPAIQTCDQTDGWTLCQCTEDKCNNVTNTAKLMEYATSTTTTTTTTTTTVTTTTVSTTTTTTDDSDASSGKVDRAHVKYS